MAARAACSRPDSGANQLTRRQVPMIKYGDLPFTEAIDFFRAKVLVETQGWTDVWKEANDIGFHVAGAMKGDLVDDLKRAVDRGLADGTTIAQFRKEFDQIVARHGWTYKGTRGWRTRLIFETNLRTAYQAGRWQQIQAVKDRRPFLRYKHSDSVASPRPLHVAWDGLVIRADDPWWGEHYPPNGWGCKCRAFALSQRDLDRLGKSGPDAPPDNGSRPWTNPATGEVLQVPKGIDPGWDYAPGASRLQRLQQQTAAKLDKMEPPLAAAVSRATDNQPPALRTPMFSTVKGFDETSLQAILRGIPGASAQINQLATFLDRHEIKTLILKQAEMGRRSKSGARIVGRVGAFLQIGTALAQQVIGTRRASRTSGFTYRELPVVVVKARATDKASSSIPADFPAAVEGAIARPESDPLWSMRAALDEISEGPGQIVTWIHEVAHQIHFAAGSPAVPAGLPRLTEYSGTSPMEWHAEHIAAWVINRAALERWSPTVASYIDNLMEPFASSAP